jgi:hypothetical protein
LTEISGAYAAQGTCLMSDSLLQCLYTQYSSRSAFTTTTFSASPYYVTLTFPATSTASSTTRSSIGAIIGGVVGSVVFVIIVVALLLFYRRRRNADHIVTVENNKPMQPELDSSVMENSPSLPRQTFTKVAPVALVKYNTIPILSPR